MKKITGTTITILYTNKHSIHDKCTIYVNYQDSARLRLTGPGAKTHYSTFTVIK